MLFREVPLRSTFHFGDPAMSDSNGSASKSKGSHSNAVLARPESQKSTSNGSATQSTPSLGLQPQIRIEDHVVPKSVRRRVQKARKGEILNQSYPYRTRMKTSDYESQKALLQVEL